MNKNEVTGKVEQAKGEVKKKVGEWTGDSQLQAEGEVDALTGRVREALGTAERKAKDAVDKIKDATDK